MQPTSSRKVPFEHPCIDTLQGFWFNSGCKGTAPMPLCRNLNLPSFFCLAQRPLHPSLHYLVVRSTQARPCDLNPCFSVVRLGKASTIALSQRLCTWTRNLAINTPSFPHFSPLCSFAPTFSFLPCFPTSFFDPPFPFLVLSKPIQILGS